MTFLRREPKTARIPKKPAHPETAMQAAWQRAVQKAATGKPTPPNEPPTTARHDRT